MSRSSECPHLLTEYVSRLGPAKQRINAGRKRLGVAVQRSLITHLGWVWWSTDFCALSASAQPGARMPFVIASANLAWGILVGYQMQPRNEGRHVQRYRLGRRGYALLGQQNAWRNPGYHHFEDASRAARHRCRGLNRFCLGVPHRSGLATTRFVRRLISTTQVTASFGMQSAYATQAGKEQLLRGLFEIDVLLDNRPHDPLSRTATKEWQSRAGSFVSCRPAETLWLLRR